MATETAFELVRPQALWLLAGIPVVLAILFRSFKRDWQVFRVLRHKGSSPRVYVILAVLWGLMLANLSVIAADPRINSYELSENEVLGDCVFLADVSLSMEASPSPEEPRRMAIAKHIMQDMIKELPLRCQIFAYAGLAFPISPMLGDTEELLNVIEHGLYKEVLPMEGSEVAHALAVVANHKLEYPEVYSKLSHVVLFSDGDLGSAHPRRIEEAMDLLQEVGIELVIVGIGHTGRTERIHIFDADGNFTGQYVQMRGNRYAGEKTAVWEDKFSDTELRELASRANGKYFSQNEADALMSYLSEAMDTEPAEAEEVLSSNSLAGIFAALLFIPVLLLFFMSRKLY